MSYINLESVAIPNTIAAIYDGALSGNKLTSIIIPSSVEKIGAKAFNVNLLPQNQAYIYSSYDDKETLVSYGGASAEAVIPNEVKVIGYDAFNNANLISVDLNDELLEIRDYAFQGNQLSSVVIPDGVSTIGFSAFAYNKLTTLSVSANTTEIACQAFYGNPRLLELDDFSYSWNSSLCG